MRRINPTLAAAVAAALFLVGCSGGSPAASPESATVVDATYQDPELGDEITIERVLAGVPVPQGYGPSVKDIVLVEVTVTVDQTEVEHSLGSFELQGTAGRAVGAGTPQSSSDFPGFELLRRPVGTAGQSATETGWLVFTMRDESEGYTLRYERGEIFLLGAPVDEQIVPETWFEHPLP